MRVDSEPTKTVGLRNEFRVALSKRFRALRTAIRVTVEENDALQLSDGPGSIYAAAGDIGPTSGFAFSTDAEAQDAFLDWLDTQIERGVLESTSRTSIRNGEHYTGRYIHSAYSRGVDHADAKLNATGLEVPEEDLQAIFNRGVDQENLQGLYTRAFDELEDITQDMQTGIRRELAEGFAQGENPKKVARRLTDRVDKVGITRSERLARTEIMNAHETATRSRYRQMGVEMVEIVGTSPCKKICAPIVDNGPYPINNIPRGGTPFHPNCVGTTVPATDSEGNILRASATDVARVAA